MFVGVIMHELLHCCGFMHEQARKDRDKYVKVYYENIEKGKGKAHIIYYMVIITYV
jgi:hypothetical protein